MALGADLASPETLSGWLAAKREGADVVTPGLVDRFHAMMRRPMRKLRAGDVAPAGLHWCLAPEALAYETLGRDGMPVRGSLYPSLRKLTSIMWGGATIDFKEALRVGDEVERVSRITELEEKAGRAGRLAFATLVHEYRVRGQLCVRETQAIAFREPAPLGAADDSAPGPDRREEPWELRREVRADSILLFEYSALTFNPHRIHYDQPYAKDVESYPALVVQGPLQAALLVDLCAEKFGTERLRSVKVMARRPAFNDTTLTFAARSVDAGVTPLDLAVLDDRGQPLMMGSATLRD